MHLAVTRREALAMLGTISVAPLLTRWSAAAQDAAPSLAPGTPTSPERMALIETFRRESAGLEERFEARSFKGSWVMPYRLYRPQGTARLPLVVYLHGSGGLGTDNARQMGLGNIFGTRLWALPDNQKRFPCWVLAPQTDRGWSQHRDGDDGTGPGDGARVALELIDHLVSDLAIDARRIYVTGQSMGGGGVWNMIAARPRFFAAAVPCCGSDSADDAASAASTPLWNFHGDADATVPVSVSRARIAAVRKAGGHPLATEYPGVGHNSWEWAYTEPALPRWLFSQKR